MPNNYQIRSISRNQLENRIFSTNWLLMVVVFIIVGAVLALPTLIFSAFGSIITLVIAGPVMLSLAAVCLLLPRSGGAPDFKYLIYGFNKENFVRSILINILTAVFTLLWSILFVIPGIVKMYAYSASYYIALDEPKLGARACMAKSERVMQGHKFQLFMLDLSFIGWYIVGAIAFGVGTLFVIPYHIMARTNFYDKIVNP